MEGVVIPVEKLIEQTITVTVPQYKVVLVPVEQKNKPPEKPDEDIIQAPAPVIPPIPSNLRGILPRVRGKPKRGHQYEVVRI